MRLVNYFAKFNRLKAQIWHFCPATAGLHVTPTKSIFVAQKIRENRQIDLLAHRWEEAWPHDEEYPILCLDTALENARDKSTTTLKVNEQAFILEKVITDVLVMFSC